MFSRRLINRKGRFARYCLVAVAATLTGCRADGGSAVPARRASVSIERLAAQHPLWIDLERLETTARTLASLESAKSGERAQGTRFILPALLLPAASAGAGGRQQALRVVADRQLAGLSQRLETQLAHGLEREQQRRVRTIAAREAQARRIAEADVVARTRELQDRDLEEQTALGVRILNLEININALEQDLRIVRLLLPTARTELGVRLGRLRAELGTVEKQVVSLETAAAEQARREVYARVAASLPDGLAGRNLPQIRARVQLLKTALREDLGRLAAVPALPQSGRSAAGEYVVEVSKVVPGRSGIVTYAAITRVREQKERLRAMIFAETRMAARDAAAARKISVSFEGATSGWPDRTEQFSRWMAEGGTEGARQ